MDRAAAAISLPKGFKIDVDHLRLKWSDFVYSSDSRVAISLSDAWSGSRKLMALSKLGVGEDGVVSSLDLPEDVQYHLMHMGFVPEARVLVLRRAPAGDPTVYAIDGIEIALRRDTADAIRVRRTGEARTADDTRGKR